MFPIAIVRLCSGLTLLCTLAKRTGRTKTYYAREAILQHLEDLEDIYLAEKRLAAIRSGRTKTILLDEVMRRYGLPAKRKPLAKKLSS